MAVTKGKKMEVRAFISPTSKSFLNKFASERGYSLGAAVDQILLQIVKQGGIEMTYRVTPDDDTDVTVAATAKAKTAATEAPFGDGDDDGCPI